MLKISQDKGGAVYKINSCNFLLFLGAAFLFFLHVQLRAEELSVNVENDTLSQEQTPKYFLKEIVVTANRYEKDSYKIPMAMSVVGKEKMERENSQIIVDLLRNLPGVDVNDAGPFNSRPTIRGLLGSRILLLVDGERLNDTRESPFSGAQLSLIDMDAVDRVEVVRGPGSVLYGTDALGGVLNVITKKPAFNAEPGTHYGYAYRMRFSTIDNQVKTRFNQFIRNDRWTLTFGGEARNARDYKSGYGTVLNSALGREHSFDVEAGYKIHPNHNIYVNYNGLRAKNVGFALTSQLYSTNKLWYPFRNRDKVAIEYEGKNLGKHMPLLKGKIYYQNLKKEFDTELKTFPFVFTRTKTDVGLLGANFQELFYLPPFNQLLTWGVDYYREMVKGENISEVKAFGSTSTTPSVPKVDWDVVGVFAQDEIKPDNRISLTLGGRYDYHRSRVKETPGYTAVSPFTQKIDFVSWSAGGTYVLVENLSFYTNFGSAFRIPNVVEKYFNGRGSQPGTVLVPNLDLKEEKSLSWDIGFKTRHNNFSGSLGYFLNNVDDYIDLRTVKSSAGGDSVASGNTLYHWVNISEVRIQGIELEAEGSLSQFYGFTNAAWMQADELSSDEPFFVPDIKLSAGIGWRQKNGRLWSEINTRLVGKQDRLPASVTPFIPDTYGFEVLNWRGSWQLSRTTSLYLGVNNITDKYYIEPYNQFGVANPIPEPGRNLVLSLDFKY